MNEKHVTVGGKTYRVVLETTAVLDGRIWHTEPLVIPTLREIESEYWIVLSNSGKEFDDGNSDWPLKHGEEFDLEINGYRWRCVKTRTGIDGIEVKLWPYPNQNILIFR